jgi:hypothetical protein
MVDACGRKLGFAGILITIDEMSSRRLANKAAKAPRT